MSGQIIFQPSHACLFRNSTRAFWSGMMFVPKDKGDGIIPSCSIFISYVITKCAKSDFSSLMAYHRPGLRAESSNQYFTMTRVQIVYHSPCMTAEAKGQEIRRNIGRSKCHRLAMSLTRVRIPPRLEYACVFVHFRVALHGQYSRHHRCPLGNECSVRKRVILHGLSEDVD